MSNLKERSYWYETIYQIAPEDPPMGGDFGLNNVAHMQLACRLTWLRDFFARQHDLADGHHFLSAKDVAKDANIPECSLDLDVPTAQLRNEVDASLQTMKNLENFVDNQIDIDGTNLFDIYKALIIYWQLEFSRISFDLFLPEFSFYDWDNNPIIDGVKGDDSLDVNHTRYLHEGEHILLINSTETEDREFVIKHILTDHRLVLTTDLPEYRHDGRLGYTTWNINREHTIAKANSVYLTKRMDTFLEGVEGELTICSALKNQFSVYYRTDYKEMWKQASITNVYFEDDLQYTVYRIFTNAPVFFRIVADTDCEVNHMVLRAIGVDDISGMLRIPRIHDRFKCVRYGSIYGIPMQSAQIQISTDSFFSNNQFQDIEIDAIENSNPEWDISTQVIAKLQKPLISGETYYWRIRNLSIENKWSGWSNIAKFTED